MMFYRRQLDIEILMLIVTMLMFALMFFVDAFIFPDVQPPQVSINIGF